MRLMQDGKAGGDRLADENLACAEVDTVKTVRSSCGVAHQPPDGVVELIDIGGNWAVAGLAEVCQVIVVDDEKQIDVPIVEKIGVKSEAEEAESRQLPTSSLRSRKGVADFTPFSTVQTLPDFPRRRRPSVAKARPVAWFHPVPTVPSTKPAGNVTACEMLPIASDLLLPHPAQTMSSASQRKKQ